MDLVTSVGVTVAGATAMFPCKQITLSQTVGAGMEYELGTDTFKMLLKNLAQEMKLKGELMKIELARKDRYWFDPPINACK